MPRAPLSPFERPAIWDRCSSREEQRIAATVDLVPPSLDSVLDVGCGDGRLLHVLARRARRAVGVDLHLEPLRRLKVRSVAGSAVQLPFRDCTFDLVLATEILEHLFPQDRQLAIAEMRRVSRELILISVPYRENLLEEVCRCAECGREFHRYGHLDAFDRDSVGKWGVGLIPERVATIVPIAKAHRLPPLYWLRYRVGRSYQWDGDARCPNCGGEAEHKPGNVVGRATRALIGRMNRLVPLTEEGWLVALFRKLD